MKVRKTMAAALAALLGVGLLAGCGSGSSNQPTAKSQDNSAAGGDVIKVGANFELTGGIATFGNSSVNGIKLALEEFNQAGGVNGKKIELITADNKSDAAEATNAMTKLVTQDKVVAVMGPVASSNVLAAEPVATQNQIPLVTPTATNPKVTVDPATNKTRDWIFRTCFIDPFQGDVAARFSFNDLKAKKAAIYVDQSSDYSKGLAEAFKSGFTKLGGEIVSEEAFVAKDTDFKATLTKIKAKNPDVIYVPAYYEEVGKIIRQARELGLTQPIVGGDGFDSPKLLEIAGKSALTNVFFTNHYTTMDTSPVVQEFVKKYKDKYGQEPDALAALAYDAAKVLFEAIKTAGTPDPVKIKDALAATKDFKGVTGTITLDAQHNPVKSAVIMEYNNGALKFRTRVEP
ncbi:ABC transporter substrate-binding protein [Carboxydocella sp. JDF658]|uniref:ABC transporter substrate-binding protein n=1 Tax=Carboxydocella sp. JDF658 TaxID=1926600 RepID=UPI0009AEB611|nr:ABC transporter substrate-binding protein [Carboxydocella sp. JDF658]GAW32444.1 amino acid/amide ABC transporter substrate-binding protein, HAAT family [Carboxydocella sp. JDF658]